MPVPLDRPSVRWGILGTGRIAGSFARDLTRVPGAELAAVGSRHRESAARFAAEHGFARPHGSYRELVDDPDVDVVYIASPHSEHLAHGRLALEAGKPVLMEKAFTLTADEAEQVFDLARERDLFCMEAMWTACHPVVREVRRRLASGDCGPVTEVHAGLGFVVDADPSDRMLAPELGGGVLLDMGVYPLSLAQMVLGDPVRQVAVAHLAPSGIDLAVSVSAAYPDGAVASLSASMTAWSPRTAMIATARGRFELPPGFHHPTYATWTPYGSDRAPGPVEMIRATVQDRVIGTGLGNEAVEVMRCLRAGLRESPDVPWASTLAVMRQMDALREQIGVRYPAERDDRAGEG